nr:tRNA (guanosine(46)-N7)-methyltransferase TrmB [Treponema pallidum]
MRKVLTFTRRSNRMTAYQKRDYQHLASRWIIPYQNTVFDYAAVFCSPAAPSAPAGAFPAPQGETDAVAPACAPAPLVVEIGFGMGSATAAIAARNPHLSYLGIEVYRAGIGRLLRKIEAERLHNLRIIEHDALDVLRTMIAPQTLAGLHIFFPDPWPKTRHHKRRLLYRPRTDLLARALAPGGYLYAVTDWAEYARRAQEELARTPSLTWAPQGARPWRPATEFERKAQTQGRAIHELFFIKA